MSIHKLTEEGKSQIKHDYIRKVIFALIIGATPTILLILINTYGINPNEFFFIIISILVSSSLIILVAFFTMRVAIKSLISLQITLDNDRLIQNNIGRPEITINRGEVRRIKEIESKGIRVESIISSIPIFLPCGLEGYEILKNNIASWQPQIDERASGFRSIIIALLACLIFAGFYITKSQMFAWLFIVFYLVAIVIQFIEIKKYPKRMIGLLDRMVITLGGIIFMIIFLTMFFKK